MIRWLPALKFGAAASDRVQMPAQANFDTKSQWSGGALIYINPITSGAQILCKASGVGSLGWFFDFEDGLGNIDIFVFTSGVDLYYKSSNTPLKANRWQFVAFSFDLNAAAGSTGRLYVSTDIRSPLSEVTYTKVDPTGTQTDDSSVALDIGNTSVNASTFTGSIAVAFVSPSTVLSLKELRDWQLNPLLKPRGCQGLWIPGQNGTGRVLDYSGLANHGTITGAIPVEGLSVSGFTRKPPSFLVGRKPLLREAVVLQSRARASM